MMTAFNNPRFRPIIGAVLMALAGALAVAVIWAVFAIRNTQVERTTVTNDTLTAATEARAAAHQAKLTGDRIEDCTEPEGECFQESQRRTVKLVQGIIDELQTTRRYSVLAAACATDPLLDPLTRAERIDAIDRCVRVALQR